MNKSFKAPPLTDSPVFSRSLLAMFLCGCLFCVLIGPLVSAFTFRSALYTISQAFWGTLSYGLIVALPFSIVLVVMFGAANNFLLILLNRFSDEGDFQRYKAAALMGSSCTGLLLIPILLVLSLFNPRSIQADAWIFAAALAIMIGAANQWAMRRHLSWVEAQLDFEAIAA